MDLGELPCQVRLLLCEALELDAPDSLNEHAYRSVRDPEHAMDHRGRADRVNVVGTGRLDLWARRGEQRDHPIARDRVVDELDGTLLANRQRAHRGRKDHRLPERQDGKHRRELGLPDLLLERRALLRMVCHGCRTTAMYTVAAAEGRRSRGSLTVRRPRSYVASAPFSATSPPTGMWRSNGP